MSTGEDGGAAVGFLVVGEALIDLVPATKGDGDADPEPASTFASTWQAQTAGGPLNTAVALARLDRTVAFGAPIGEDALARQMTAHLRANRVAVDRVPAGRGPTAMAVVSLDEAGKASYHFHAAQTATFDFDTDRMPSLADGEWLHIASLALVVRPGAETLHRWALDQRPELVSVDLNVRTIVEPDPQAYWGALEPWIDLVAERGGVVKGSDEDLDFLAPAAGLGDHAQLARHLAERGVGCVVTTLGVDGASALVDREEVRVPGRRVEVVDTVAAGDTFMAGFLDGWTTEATDPATALSRGVAAASVVVGRSGAQPPTTDEVDAVLRG